MTTDELGHRPADGQVLLPTDEFVLQLFCPECRYATRQAPMTSTDVICASTINGR